MSTRQGARARWCCSPSGSRASSSRSVQPIRPVVQDHGPSAADLTVAVNLLGREVLPEWPGGAAPPARSRPDRDVVVESLELASLGAAAQQTALADVPVTPVFGPGTWRDIHLADQYLNAGQAAMTAALPSLREFARPT